MSFSFGFEDPPADSKPRDISASIQVPQGFEPRKHSVSELAADPVRVSYTLVDGIAKRQLFDAQFQLKVQDSLSSTEKILLETNEDVRKTVYEGGLKSWESTYDLVHYIKEHNVLLSSNKNFMEMGCGTAIPSLHIFKAVLDSNTSNVAFYIADYNVDVLKLVTLPNFVINWALSQPTEVIQRLHESGADSDSANPGSYEYREGELDLSPRLIEAFSNDLKNRGIVLEFISGAWCPEFSALLPPIDLIFASETIYSLDTIPVFTDTLMRSLSDNGSALVAAKRMYFGVGGGITEFELELRSANADFEQVMSVDGSVARAILCVKKHK